jgi:hypothetical protein
MLGGDCHSIQNNSEVTFSEKKSKVFFAAIEPAKFAKLLGQCFSVPFALHDHCTRMTLCTNREV